jgi:sugar/nucleoside kinase (ribokinase family)
MAHVACVGDLMVDVLAQLPGPLAVGSDTPAPIAFHGGGAAANVAAWLVAAGAQATFLGRVGADPLGANAVTELAASGVTVRAGVDPARPTGTCIVLIDPDGERTMIPHAGANAGLGEDAFVLPADATALYVSGYALLEPGSRPFALAALAAARSAGVPIAVDAASAAPLSGVEHEFGDWVGTGVLLLANADEARVLAGGARELAARFGEAIVKLGAGGAVWSDGADVLAVPAEPTRVLDCTGAGDSFAAGFLAARGSGADAPACLAAAVQLAAHAIGQVGARPV